MYLRRDAHVLLWEKEHDLEATMRELHVAWAREAAYDRATNKDALIKNILLCRGSWAQQQLNLQAARAAVTADAKMSEIAEIELTHHSKVASSADTVRRCLRQIAEGGRSERDLRDEMSGAFHTADRRGTGHRQEHGAPVSEIAGGHQGQTSTAASIQAGPLRAN